MEHVGIDYYETELIKNMCRLRIAFYLPCIKIKESEGVEKIIYQ